MNTLNKQTMAARCNANLFKVMAITLMFLGSASTYAQPREGETLAPIAPFSAASVGIAKKADDTEQAAFQEQQALALLRQAAPTNNVGEAAVAVVKSLVPSLSAKAGATKQVQLVGAKPMTRDQVIAQYESQPIPRSSAATEDPYRAPVYHSFSIFDASSRLFEDFDYDGFYQTFSVTFDVDVYGSYLNERADLFAELYLSRNGGPWVRYYTTDVFTIYGDSTQDDYEVLTTLYTDYATDHYDVLIDVYEVGYSDIVATISADEIDGLYALPLESSDRDRETDVIIVEESGGAVSGYVLLFIVLCGALRMSRGRT